MLEKIRESIAANTHCHPVVLAGKSELAQKAKQRAFDGGMRVYGNKEAPFSPA
jgi:hypothetical protein